MTLSRFPVLTVDSLPTPAVFSEYILYSHQSPPGSLTGNMSNRTLQTGVIYHPVHGYPIPPPVPVAVARRNARERNRVKTVNDSYQHLKNHVPGAARQKRMSKVDIIKLSIEYIQKLQKSLKESEIPASDEALHPDQCMTPLSTDSGYLSHHRLSSPSSSSPASSTSSSISSSLPSLLSPVLYNPSVMPKVDADGDVLDAIIDWQDT